MFANRIDFVLDNERCFGGRAFGIFLHELFYHASMNLHVFGESFFVVLSCSDEVLLHFFKLAIEACGKNKQAHGFYKTDGFALYVLIFGMNVENSVGIFFVGAVVAQDKFNAISVVFIFVTFAPVFTYFHTLRPAVAVPSG